MKIIFKELTRDLLQKKIILSVFFIFSLFISFIYFYVHFAIDSNLTAVNNLNNLSLNLQKYQMALTSNRTLIGYITIGFSCLYVGMILQFFNHIHSKNINQRNQILMCGYRGYHIMLLYSLHIFIISFVASLVGFVLGYFLSDTLIMANRTTYDLANIFVQTKGIHVSSLITGIFLIPCTVAIITFVSGFKLFKDEIALHKTKGMLNKVKPSLMESLFKHLPLKNNFKFKLSLKNISSVTMLVTAIVTFSILFILSVSLFFSGSEVVNSQRAGRSFEYETIYSSMQDLSQAPVDNDQLYALKQEGSIHVNEETINFDFVSFLNENRMFQLLNQDSEPIQLETGITINPELSANYGYDIGDRINITINNITQPVTISAVASNAEIKTNYLAVSELDKFSVDNGHANSYNLIYSEFKPSNTMEADVTSQDDIIQSVDSTMTSNKASAIINQTIAVIIGVLLIVVAFTISLTNNVDSLLTFDLLGYNNKEISGILLNPFLVFVNIIFVLTLPIGVIVAEKIQWITAVTTKDYMPFVFNFITIVYMFIVLNSVLIIIRLFFAKHIKKIRTKENFNEYLID